VDIYGFLKIYLLPENFYDCTFSGEQAAGAKGTDILHRSMISHEPYRIHAVYPVKILF
jgi:hypothetical protein